MGVGGGAKLRSGFVGRTSDLDRLRRAVDDAVAGSGSLVLIAGEAGIGKTRLATEVAVYAEGTGATARWSAGWEGTGAPAYWPWIQLIRAHAAERAPSALADELGASADEVVRLVPELAGHLEFSAQTHEEGIGEQPRFRLFDAVASFLGRAGQTRPLVLVFDDLHWADVGSVMLLRFCSRELRAGRILLLGAYRDVDVEPESELGRALIGLQEGAETVFLGGLESPDVRELLAQDVGHHEADRLAHDVHERSGGNPLFVRELGRLLTATGRPGLGVGPSIPQSIRAVLERRFSRLSADCVALLGLAAVAGEEVGLETLERAAGVSRDAILALVDEAVRARIVRVVDRTPPQFAFTHALVRDALYERLTFAQRADMHRRLGEAVAQSGDAEPPFAEIAHHFLRAALPSDDHRAAEYSERAGRQSFARFAYEDAAGHFTRALEAIGRSEANDDDRARLLLLLGEAHLWSGGVPRAREAYEEAAALARRCGRADVLADAALGFSAGLGAFEVRLYDQAQVDLLEEALAALDTSDSSRRARVMGLLSVALTFADSPERRLNLAEDAVAMARRVGDAHALVQALSSHCDAISAPEHSERRLAASTEMVRVARDAGDACLELLGRRHRLVALLELGDISAADVEVDAYARVAETVRQPLYLWYVPMWRGMRAAMEGRLDDARRFNDELATIAERARSDNGQLLAAVLRWFLLRVEGRLAEAADVMRGQLDLVAGVAGESFWLGLTFPTVYPEEGRAAIARLGSGNFSELPPSTFWLVGMAGVALTSDVVRDAAVAEKAYEMLRPYGPRFVLDGTATSCWGSAFHYLGILAKVLGRFDDATAHFDAALDANRRMGAAALVADALSEYGSMLIEAGDRDGAEQRLHEAISIYRELGLDLRAEQIETLLASSPADVNAFKREGDFWTLSYDGRTIRLKDAKGLHDIGSLIALSGREAHVADLIAAPEGTAGAAASAQPLLDTQARAAYKRRLQELQDDLDEAERFSDAVRAERARAEMDTLAGELASALGLGGRARDAGNPAERARKAVAQRVRNAIRRIEAEHPALGRHLGRSLRMGSFCSYSPERPVDWQL